MRSVHTAVTALIALAVQTGAATAAPVTLHVLNERGIKQNAAYRIDGGSWYATDAYGEWPLNVILGSVVDVTRHPGGPEGANGVTHTIVQADIDSGSLTMTVPNATGPAYHPELSDAERWLVGKLNAHRASRGLAPLPISTTLTAAADAIARDSVLTAATAGSWPFPPPYYQVVLQDWGWPSSGGGGLDAGGTHPSGALAHWTDGSVREQLLLRNDINAIGIGEGGGSWIAEFARCPPAQQGGDRCGMTSDLGDPNIVLPEPTTNGGTAGGGSTTGGGTTGGGGTKPGGSTTGGGTKPGGGTGSTGAGGAAARPFKGRTSQTLSVRFKLASGAVKDFSVWVYLTKACGGKTIALTLDTVAIKNRRFAFSARVGTLDFTIAGTVTGTRATGSVDYRRTPPGAGHKKKRKRCRAATLTWSAAAS